MEFQSVTIEFENFLKDDSRKFIDTISNTKTGIKTVNSYTEKENNLCEIEYTKIDHEDIGTIIRIFSEYQKNKGIVIKFVPVPEEDYDDGYDEDDEGEDDYKEHEESDDEDDEDDGYLDAEENYQCIRCGRSH